MAALSQHPRWGEGTLADNVQVPTRSLNRVRHKELRKGASPGTSILSAQRPSPPSGVPSWTVAGGPETIGFIAAQLEGGGSARTLPRSHADGHWWG